MRKIESANSDGPLSHVSGATHVEDQFATKERYKSLIRQLPARGYVEKLIEVYFREFNWQYYALEEDLFMQQFAEWNNIPFNVLSNSGPQGLSPDLRVFPALLFQVLATALLTLPEGSHEFYEHLKYAGNMTFEDLAADYSDSGVGILSLLGKRQITLTTVQASFLRAAFLKYMAKVTESVRTPALLVEVEADCEHSGMPLAARFEMPRKSACTVTAWIRSPLVAILKMC